MIKDTKAPDFGNVFVATAAVILPLAAFAPLAIAWAAAIPALWIALIYFRSGRYPWAGRAWLIPAAFAALIAYGALTTIWSITPDRSQDIAIRLVPIILGGWLLVGAAAQLDARARQRTATALVIGSGVTLILIAVEIATGGLIKSLLLGKGFDARESLYHLNRAASVVAVLIWPLWLTLVRRLGIAAAAGAAVLVAIILLGLDPDTPLFVLFAGSVFLAFAYFAPQCARLLLIAGLVAAAAGIPVYPEILPAIDSTLVTLNLSDFTLQHRFAIWDFTAAKTMEHPLLGWGLGASRAIPGADGIATQLGGRAEVLPLHPHNALLQLWLELGLPGILLTIIAFVVILIRIPRYIAGRKELAMSLTVIFSVTLIAELSYGLWQSWWLAFLWVLAALTIAIADGRSERQET